MRLILFILTFFALLACNSSNLPPANPTGEKQEDYPTKKHSNQKLVELTQAHKKGSISGFVVLWANQIVNTNKMTKIQKGYSIQGSSLDELSYAIEICKKDHITSMEYCSITYQNETPKGSEYVSTFWLDKYEVTVEEYKRCVDAGMCAEIVPSGTLESLKEHCSYSLELDEHPVNCVNWYQADDYCRWRGKRLPSAIEWEKASRGSEGNIFPWGNESSPCDLDKQVNNRCEGWLDEPGETVKTGSVFYDKSDSGIMDLAGNVSEWTSSEASQGTRIVKGGSRHSSASDFRGAFFSSMEEENSLFWLGFRCAYSEPIAAEDGKTEQP